MKILAIHGLGGWEQELAWQETWKEAFTTAIRLASGSDPDVHFLAYDDIFESKEITFADTMRAMGLLLGSALGLGSRGGMLVQARSYWRWYAGMVVHWVENEAVRKETRKRLRQTIEELQPEVVVAHSLGSLIGYDTAIHPDSRGAFEKRTLITLGSQIGNPFVVGQFLAGRIRPLANSAFWFHLYNDEDDVFTAPINLNASNYRQVNTHFDAPGWADHDALEYIKHPNTVRYVWSILSGSKATRQLLQTLPAGRSADARSSLRRRALIVGIDEYPNPEHRLAGCVNDAFLMSAVLQESGFKAEEIRLLLNDRATTDQILERFAWLLEDVQDGDELYFHYSGHGTVLPSYNVDYKVERIYESLVPYDYDGSADYAITDIQLSSLYSQITYKAYFVISLDCCHAGGLTRGSGAKVRGLDPPDDVRHRMLEWNPDKQLWIQREREDLSSHLRSRERSMMFVGNDGSTMRLGAAMSLRTLSSRKYEKTRKAQGHLGPYMPVILQACAAEELAQEYLHGSVSYGAFTYVAAKVLRDQQQAGGSPITYQQLITKIKSTMQTIGVNQTPAASGPEAILKGVVPYRQAVVARSPMVKRKNKNFERSRRMPKK